MRLSKFALLFLSMTLVSELTAQPTLATEQLAIQQTVVNFFEALSKRDSVSLKKECTTDIALYEHGRIWNADSLVLNAITLNTASDFKRTNRFEFLNTTVAGHTGWATYQLTSERTQNGRQSTVQWLETVVLVKKHREWKIQVLHSTLTKRL